MVLIVFAFKVGPSTLPSNSTFTILSSVSAFLIKITILLSGFTKANEAMSYVETGRSKGKVVVKVNAVNYKDFK